MSITFGVEANDSTNQSVSLFWLNNKLPSGLPNGNNANPLVNWGTPVKTFTKAGRSTVTIIRDVAIKARVSVSFFIYSDVGSRIKYYGTKDNSVVDMKPSSGFFNNSCVKVYTGYGYNGLVSANAADVVIGTNVFDVTNNSAAGRVPFFNLTYQKVGVPSPGAPMTPPLSPSPPRSSPRPPPPGAQGTPEREMEPENTHREPRTRHDHARGRTAGALEAFLLP